MILRSILKAAVDSLIAFEALFVAREKHPQEKRVLILRKDGLGDCIIFYPTLKAYREFYKDAKLTLVFPSIFKPLAPLLSDANEVIWFDHGSFRESYRYRRKFMLDLKRRGYDITLYPSYSQEQIARTMLKMTGAANIVTFDDVKTEKKSELERDIDFAEHVTGKKLSVSFPTILTDSLPATKFDLKDPYAVVFPGTSFALYRRWPNDRFAAIIEKIISSGLTPVLCGSSKEKELVEDIISKLSPLSKEEIINLSGETDFADMAHILKKATFYFGSDTGILHIAVAVGTPAIGLIGTGGFKRFFPYGDLAKNRAVYDQKSMEGKYPIGTWEGVENTGTPHPSIEAITIEQASREIDYMLEFLYPKSHEKPH